MVQSCAAATAWVPEAIWLKVSTVDSMKRSDIDSEMAIGSSSGQGLASEYDISASKWKCPSLSRKPEAGSLSRAKSSMPPTARRMEGKMEVEVEVEEEDCLTAKQQTEQKSHQPAEVVSSQDQPAEASSDYVMQALLPKLALTAQMHSKESCLSTVSHGSPLIFAVFLTLSKLTSLTEKCTSGHVQVLPTSLPGA